MLVEEFLKPLGISQSAFAIRLGVSFPRLNDIIRQKRSVTPDTALRLAPVTECVRTSGCGCSWIGIFGMFSAPKEAERIAKLSPLPRAG